jgi:hypothetical protein
MSSLDIGSKPGAHPGEPFVKPCRSYTILVFALHCKPFKAVPLLTLLQEAPFLKSHHPFNGSRVIFPSMPQFVNVVKLNLDSKKILDPNVAPRIAWVPNLSKNLLRLGSR